MADPNTDAFFALSDHLSKMQQELSAREWTSDRARRIEQAGEFRRKMFDLIAAYRDECTAYWKPAKVDQ
jgi:hypothetical protein